MRSNLTTSWTLFWALLWTAILCAGCFGTRNESKPVANTDYLSQGFLNPPDSIKPYCYWYWISGNISKEGITKDLESMARVGIGGAFIGNIGMGEPYGDVKVLDKNWWDLTKHAIREGTRLGIDIGVFNSPGWSQSGGPWVSSSQAMRYLSASEKIVTGGKRIHIVFPVADTPYQDVAILAFPKPAKDRLALTVSGLKSNPSTANLNLLFDRKLNDAFNFPKSETLTIDIEAKMTRSVGNLTLHAAKTPFMADVELQAQVNGQFIPVKSFQFDRSNPNVNVGPMPFGEVSVSFPSVQASKFRIIFRNITGKKKIAGTPDDDYHAALTEITLSEAPRLEYFVEKQLGKMFQTPLPLWGEYQWKDQQEVQSDQYVAQDAVVDLTSYRQSDGSLSWDAPTGDWVVMRITASPTGTKNSPASPEATGYEVDKMNRQHLAHHFNSYLGKLLREMPKEERTAFKFLVADSYEMGSQNYTEGFAADFEKKFGYNPMLWLPVLSGRIVGSANQSNRFLWDLRRFVADRVAYDYVGGLRDLAEKNGLRVWLENYGHWGYPSEFLMYGGQSHEIAGEFWTEGTLGDVECRAASSAAHIYGVNRVYAESFTGAGKAFSFHPARLKKRGDWSFTEGINHVLLHVYIHQPYEDKNPGMNAWFGTEFNRKNTWFEQSKPWIDYLRRNMFILQQGKPVNDVCYFIGEDAPKMTGVRDPEIPKGYSYDYINAEVLINRMKVKDGLLVLPDGMRYHLLVLPKLETMRPALLRKIEQLVADGAKILGPKPLRSPSLQNFPSADGELLGTANQLWAQVDGAGIKSASYGKGTVMNGMTMQEALNHIKLLPDLASEAGDPILWTHRKTKDADLYFITNQSEGSIQIAPTFRVGDKQPELWDATTGRRRVLSQYTLADGRITVPLKLESTQSYFVVFRDPLKTPGGVNFPEAKPLLSINGPWQVRFDSSKRGPAEAVTFATLTDWSKHEDKRIRFYSGTANYVNQFDVKSLPKSGRVYLQFDAINNMARIKVNGKEAGSLWTAPFKLDVTEHLIAGKNTLEVEVVNLWVNRMIGDSKLPKADRKTWLAINQFKPADPLLPSGLTGEVKLVIH